MVKVEIVVVAAAVFCLASKKEELSSQWMEERWLYGAVSETDRQKQRGSLLQLIAYLLATLLCLLKPLSEETERWKKHQLSSGIIHAWSSFLTLFSLLLQLNQSKKSLMCRKRKSWRLIDPLIVAHIGLDSFCCCTDQRNRWRRIFWVSQHLSRLVLIHLQCLRRVDGFRGTRRWW